MKAPYSVLFLGKKDDPYTAEALAITQERFTKVSAHIGNWGDPFPKSAQTWNGDYIISFLSRWIIPSSVLKSASKAAINFHPAPPEYPGIGCTNFALYDEASTYGVTCHHMAASADTGEIIAVKRFPLRPDDSVASLLKRTYEQQIELFKEVILQMAADKPLKASGEKWAKKATTRKEFDELCRITPDMSKEEVAKRIRATAFGPWKPTIELHGFTFELKDQKKT